ncbi:MAG: hypothetical protein GY754_46660 [bacterium]|nr:hypothetical protein [bacterium]
MPTKDPNNLLESPFIKTVTGKLGPIVYVDRNGTNYPRKWGKPRNPKTRKQQIHRKNFTRLISAWRGLNKEAKNTWNHYTRKNHNRMSGYNAFIGYNIKRLKEGKTIIEFINSENTEFIKYLESKPKYEIINEKTNESIEFVYIYTMYPEKSS